MARCSAAAAAARGSRCPTVGGWCSS